MTDYSEVKCCNQAITLRTLIVTVMAIFRQRPVLVQIWPLLVDFVEHIVERTGEQQHLLLNDPCLVRRNRDIRVSMLACEVWVSPEIAGVPRERCHDPVTVCRNGGNHRFVGQLRGVINRDSICLLLLAGLIYRPG